MSTTLDIVVPTFHREALLAALLRSVATAEPDSRLDLRILVVDNSDAGTAEPTVRALALPVPVRYLQAHPPNIAVARNAGLAAATADWIAFLDDDQTVAPGWLRAVADAMTARPWDAHFGPITPVFEATAVPELARRLFTRASPGPDGTELTPGGRHGFALSTSNMVFRRARMVAEPEPFDLWLGANGGEDILWLTRMHRQGRRYGWLAGAHATDAIPASRCTSAYLAKRMVAGGQAYALTQIRTSAAPRRTAAALAVTSALKLAVDATRWTAAAATGRSGARARFAMAVAGHWGKLTWADRRRPLYRFEDRFRAKTDPISSQEDFV